MRLATSRSRVRLVPLAAVVVTVAAGVNVAAFTMVMAVWHPDTGLRDIDRLVMLLGDTSRIRANDTVALADLSIVANTGVFDDVAGQVITSGKSAGFLPELSLDAVPRPLEVLGVTANYFAVLGVPVRGRGFLERDNDANAEPVAVISERLWRTAFGGRAVVIGTVIAATPLDVRIVGVAPAGFHGARLGEQTDLWIPTHLAARVSAMAQAGAPRNLLPPLAAIARLRESESPADAERRLGTAGQSPRVRQFLSQLHVVPLRRVFGSPESPSILVDDRPAATLVFALSGLVLAAACVTLATLLMARWERRRAELAVRAALGASRASLVGTLCGELVPTAVAGAAGACLAAALVINGLPALHLPGGVDLSRVEVSLDLRALGVALILSIATLALAALVPILKLTRSGSALTGSLVSAGRATFRLRRGLLVLHAGMTMVVVLMGALFVRTVIEGFGSGTGFAVNKTVFVDFQIEPPLRIPGRDPEARDAYRIASSRRVLDAITALPGVQGVARGSSPIGLDQTGRAGDAVAWTTAGQTKRTGTTGVLRGSAGLSDVLGIPLERGRRLASADADASPRPALVTASLAQWLWPDEEPLGRRLALDERQEYVVTGVLRDFQYGSLSAGTSRVLVTAVPIDGAVDLHLAISSDRPDELVAPLVRTIKAALPGAAAVRVSTGADILARDLGRQRLGAWLFSVFGVVALALVLGSEFGSVRQFGITQRRELAIRMALGATSGRVVRYAVGAGLRPVLIGAAGGLGLAALAAATIRSTIPGVKLLDPVAYAAAAALLLGGALLAGVMAAVNVRRLAAVEALRTD